jgi:hypothetical protein
MWNKIGGLLGYPETWCEFVLSILGVCIALTFLGCFGFMLVLPLFVFFITELAIIPYIIVLVISFAASGIGWFILHLTLKDDTYWYPSLLNKIPSCPKIKWNKENN